VVVPPNSTSQNFTTTTGYVKLSTLSGRVTDVYGHPLIGVAMDDANGQLTTTDDQGFYSFTDLPDGQYTITPTKDGYEFHPQPAPVTVHGENIGGLNYTGLKVYNITGCVTTQNGDGIEGVVISDNFGNQFTTDKDGCYTISGIPVGGFTLTAIKPGYTFTPDWQYVEVDSSDVTSIDYIGQAP
jgi:inhibitor of cysteine peptidase